MPIYLCAGAFGLADATYSSVIGSELGSRFTSEPEAAFSIGRLAAAFGTSASMFITAGAVPYSTKLQTVTYMGSISALLFLLSYTSVDCFKRFSRRIRFLPPEADALPALIAASTGAGKAAKAEPFTGGGQAQAPAAADATAAAAVAY